MNKIVLAIILAVLGLGAIGAVVVINNRDNNDSTKTDMTHSNDMDSYPTDSISTQPTITDDSTLQNDTASVDIEDFAFNVATITIKKGTKVTWVNKDNVAHDVTADDGDTDAFKGSGKLLTKNESYSFTFDQPGVYTYHCSPHPYMTGTITVVE